MFHPGKCFNIVTVQMITFSGFFCLFVYAGVICEVKQVSSQPKLITRKTDQMPDEVSKLEDDIQHLIDQIHSLSDGKTRSFSVTGAEEGIDLNAYYGILSKLYGLFQPLMRERFTDDLPKTLVCILSGRQNCGLEAELIKTVSVELGQPLLTFLLSLRSQTCTPPNTDGESSSFFWTFLRMGEEGTPLSGFQQTFINMLSTLSLSENVMNSVSGLLDTAVTYLLKFMAMVLQVPMDYIRIALQFGIKVPYLDEEETCNQGKTST